MHPIPVHPYHREFLAEQLRQWLPDAEQAARDALAAQFDWQEVQGGEVLLRQGDPGDDLFLVVSGRLRAFVRDDTGAQRPVRDLRRGELVGEMSLITGEPRTATVSAVRTAVVARLDVDRFEDLLAASVQLTLALTRQLIHRLRTEGQQRGPSAPATIGVMAVSGGVDAGAFAQSLAVPMRLAGRVCVVGAADAAPLMAEGGDTEQRLLGWLTQIEIDHDQVLLVADEPGTAWTQFVARHGDEVLLLADATQPPVLHPIEQAHLVGRDGAAQILVLLHPADARMPRGTRAWLDRRPMTDHCHVRRGADADLARLARLQTRTAVGLVMAGGGARGFAHLGVYRALRERGIEVDCVGGTSIGAVMAAVIAAGQPYEQTMSVVRQAFRGNPTGDWNLLPLISLIRGARLKRVLRDGLLQLCGAEPDIEDLWKSYFCVATNVSDAREQVIVRGDLARCLRASFAIPGALPPVVIDGQLMCDGGTLNNFPADVMQSMRGVGRVIGVDLNVHKPRRFAHDEVPGPWALLLDRLRPKRARRYRLPSLASYLMSVTIVYSLSRHRQARQHTDLCFSPPLERVGLLQWNKFDQIVEQGFRDAVAVLDGLPAAQPAAG